MEREIENPKVIVSNMKVNGWEHEEKDVILCFETNGDTMDLYIACK